MAGIVGITEGGRTKLINESLETIEHRGRGGSRLLEHGCATLGQVDSRVSADPTSSLDTPYVVCDGSIYDRLDATSGTESPEEILSEMYAEKGPEFVRDLDGPFALAAVRDDGIFVARDPLGVCPLYYGSHEGSFCFASEVKALLGWAEDIREFPPGSYYLPSDVFVSYQEVTTREPSESAAEDATDELRDRLSDAVSKCLGVSSDTGCWLSGGLDSSAISAIASMQSSSLKTFAAGVEGAPDLEHAKVAARSIGTDHYERVVTLQEMLATLPQVIYHLESFDALLVRSSIVNFLAGEMASDYVDSVLSGEGGDELFAGYEYLKKLAPEQLPEELVDIINRLHNTALQRVDRCSSAHGLTAHTPFLDGSVLDCALSMPHEYKIMRDGGAVEKWALRKAMEGMLPESILVRPKAKFWEGAGVEDMISRHVEASISDEDFIRERGLLDGSPLNSKEELFYYRIFREHFGDIEDLSFVGRTKGAPKA